MPDDAIQTVIHELIHATDDLKHRPFGFESERHTYAAEFILRNIDLFNAQVDVPLQQAVRRGEVALGIPPQSVADRWRAFWRALPGKVAEDTVKVIVGNKVKERKALRVEDITLLADAYGLNLKWNCLRVAYQNAQAILLPYPMLTNFPDVFTDWPDRPMDMIRIAAKKGISWARSNGAGWSGTAVVWSLRSKAAFWS